ncbi:MAG: glycine cleavage system aminomethyltransferase GcvT [Thermoleophilia bacterium]|nr:glycine cleavage system aminomethyltransferase GcvT [Thermoleophilia bacterium]
MTDLRRTTLYDKHVAASAKIVPFAGWEMPVEYAGVRTEHLGVRSTCGLFDVSHMGQIEVTGPAAREFLQATLTNDITRLGPGQAQYTLLPDDDGGVIDDLLVYALRDRFLLVVNASNIAPCWERLEGLAPVGVDVLDRSPQVAMLALQGPRWARALTPISSPEPFSLPYMEATVAGIAGVPCLVARTGYTGEPGVEIMCDADLAPQIWDALMGVSNPPMPAGLAARDTLRLEMGYPLYGHELGRDRSPISAGLKWACDLTRGGFPGAKRMLREAQEGTPDRLVGIVLTEKGIPRGGCAVMVGERQVGTVTSGTLSPSLGIGAALAYVSSDYAHVGTTLSIDVRGKEKAAEVISLPLVDSSPRKEHHT